MLQRILAIIQKEFAQALRDRTTLAIMISMPLLQLILFGYAISTNVRYIPTIIADQSFDQASRDFIAALVDSQYFDPAATAEDAAGVIRALDAGQVPVGVVIPPDFAGRIRRGEAQVLVLVDGSDLFTSQSAYNAASLIGQAQNARIVMQQAGGGGNLPALNALIQVLYNPDLKDLWFIIPGMVAMLLQTQSITLTAAAVVREREAGTIEQILVTPIRPFELMLGKIVPYLVIAMINMLTVVFLGVFWFGVPFQGNFVLFTLLALIYVFSGLGLGVLISTISQNQRQVMQFIMVVTTLGIVLSGFIFPRYTMPGPIRALGNLFPLTYFIPISRGIMTRGIGFETVAGDVLALLGYILVVVLLASLAFRERLE